MTRLPLIVLLAVMLTGVHTAAQPVRVATKNFNESYLLGEIMAQALEAKGVAVERRFGLGGTLICYGALTHGEIDVYPEYTGTLAQAILGLDHTPDVGDLNDRVSRERLTLLPPFGFNNTYALVMRADRAGRLGIETISDLIRHQDLDIVVSHEFLERDDGWPGLRRTYGFSVTPTGIEHGLAYQALNEGSIDVTDAYSTDGELVRYKLTVLADNRGFFPPYLAAPLASDRLPDAATAALRTLAGSLDDAQMRELNAQVVLEGHSFAQVAARFLAATGVETGGQTASKLDSLVRNTLQHLKLTGMALSLAIVVALALAISVFSIGWLSNGVIYICGLLQTIPSIALLALMIPLFGIGLLPAVVALFLYSLLPILRNAITALTTIDPTLIRVGVAMGLNYGQQLRHVYVPLALPNVLAGVRTAAVISIGTATLAAFIGAGGLGDPIVTGLALNDVGLILEGAVPAAMLAIVTELAFEALERLILPKHLVAG